MKFLMVTIVDAITLGGNGTIDVLKWWVDALYAVHPDLKSQTVGTMSLGQGCITSAPKKQKSCRQFNSRHFVRSEEGIGRDILPS